MIMTKKKLQYRKRKEKPSNHNDKKKIAFCYMKKGDRKKEKSKTYKEKPVRKS